MQQQLSSRRVAPILGVLGALGPLAIDMYLPGMPQIAADLHVGESQLQFTLMAFFIGLMLGQLFYGPLSDRTGRRPMIYVGLLVFAFGSLGCAFAGTAEQLVVWRFVQGLGGSIGMVIGLAMVRDLYTGKTAASLVALIMIVVGVAPIVAPLLGTAIMAVAPWRAMFVLLAAYSLLALVLVRLALPETRYEGLRKASNPLAALHNYAHLLVSRNFIAYVATTALAQAGFFAYLAGSSFVFISVLEVSPTAYSVIFALNAVGLMLGAQLAPRLLGRWRAQTIVRSALLVYGAAAVLLCLLQWDGGVSLLPLSALLFVVITAMAFVMPLNSMMAMESYGAIAGTAAALMGALQFGSGALASLVVGATANGTAMPMIATMTLSGLLACLLAWFALPGERRG